MCLTDGPSVQQNVHLYYQNNHPGEVQVLGVDLWNGTPAGVTSFRNSTGATYPLLMLGATATGGNLDLLYGPWDNFVVINKQGIVRYHAALDWAHGERYHLDEIRATVDSLVAPTVGVGDGEAPRFSLAAAPNPFRSRTVLSLAHPGPGAAAATVTVHDVSGRVIARPFRGLVSAGVTRIEWDGLGADGAPAPPGLYLVTAQLGARRLGARVALIR